MNTKEEVRERFREEDRYIVEKLRGMASSGTTIRAMIDAIEDHYGSGGGLAIQVDYLFSRGFHLPLGQVREVEACTRLGGRSYSDEEIDKLLLPLIEATRHLWDISLSDYPSTRRRLCLTGGLVPSAVASIAEPWPGS